VAYADDEESVDSGEPQRLLEFIGPQISYRYTSGDQPVTYNGEVYAPAVAVESAIGSGGIADAPAVVIKLLCSTQLVGDYGFTMPPRTLRLRIHERQARSAEYRVIWDGRVTAINPEGRWAEVRSESHLGSALSANVPAISFQRHCNHFLYDARCRVDRNAHDFATNVTNVNGAIVTVASIGAAADQHYRAGEIVRSVDGERRTIVDQTGAVLTLAAPFRALANGNPVTLYAGCDHLIATCHTKFNNRANFGGHPSVPSSNPFLIPINLNRGT
jgi:uncharacterized phage protein (TIGR02218 family)